QRQAHRRRGRPAALRRRAPERDQRQGRRAAEPAALDQPAVARGDLRASDRLPLPLPRLRITREFGERGLSRTLRGTGDGRAALAGALHEAVTAGGALARAFGEPEASEERSGALYGRP